MGRDRAGWRPEKLRERREAHNLTLEAMGERLRDIAHRVGISSLATDVRALWQHEQGEVFPGPHYRRAYRLLYRATESDLGFREALPGEETDRLPYEFPGVAVAEALQYLVPTPTKDSRTDIRQRVLDAWQNQSTGADQRRSLLLLIGGFAGSGKSEFARFLSHLTRWPLLDKDPLTRPFVERLLTALGCDPDDRHSDTYKTEVRPLEYGCLMEAVLANVEGGISTVATAPFVAEMTRHSWMQELSDRCAAHQVDVVPVWLDCDADSMREHITVRAAARDAWKLSNWETYVQGLDLALRPAVPHLRVDNRHGSAIAAADRVRYALGTAPA